jgi:hypothetical protein
MIIKSMSRKEPSFSQLLDYMESGRADERFTIHHNLFGHTHEQIKEEFYRNSKLLRRRSGGNYMYHEVISISRSERLKLDEQKEKLRQIAFDYIQNRAKNNLAYGALHDDHDNNIHFHLIISANEVQSRTRFRLPKHEFAQIKKTLEKRVLEHYPELQQKELINRKSEEHLSNKGGELKRRTGKTPQRDQVREKVRKIFEQAATREELLAGFDRERLDFYMRGKNPGVIDRDTGRKYRIKTLGFMSQFQTVSQKIETDLQQNYSTTGTTNTPSQEMSEAKKKTDTSDKVTVEAREEEEKAKSTQEMDGDNPSQKLSEAERRDQLKREKMANRRTISQQHTGKKDGQKR